MTPLRRRMIEDMTLRNFAPQHDQAYLRVRRPVRLATSTPPPNALAPSTSAPTCSIWSRRGRSPGASTTRPAVPCSSSTASPSARTASSPRSPAPRRPRRSRSSSASRRWPVPRRPAQPQAPRHAHDRLRRRVAPLRGRHPPRRGHRQCPHGHPRSTGQGAQGSRRDALAAAAGHPPRVLEDRTGRQPSSSPAPPRPAAHPPDGPDGL